MIEKLKDQKLKIDLVILSKLKNAVKKNFEKIEDEEISIILKNFPFLETDIKNRIKNKILFQPGRIVETMIIQTIANNLNCIYSKNGFYENDKYRIKQDGGSGKYDLIIIDKKENKEIIFEIKEPIAYGKSCGFTYNDDGVPDIFTAKVKNDNDKKFKEYVQSLFDEGGFLEKYNILENQGHNKIFNINDIITNYFDYIISYESNGNLSIMTLNEYRNNFSFKVEIRSCGRNTRKVFTKNKLNLIDDKFYPIKDKIIEIIPRGGKISSRFKYIHSGATFSFKKKDLKENVDGVLYVELKKINQHVGEVSIQHFKNS